MQSCLLFPRAIELAINIETVTAVEDLDGILALPNIDLLGSITVGGIDLVGSMDLQRDNIDRSIVTDVFENC